MRLPLPALLLFACLSHAFAAPELISSAASGSTASGTSAEPSLSSDGSVVVFSANRPLLPEDTNTIPDVYARHRATGKLRLVSDDRGGDQPIVSASGRFVVFRSLERFPKLRIVDLDSDEPPRTVSFPNDTGFSFRYADTATVTADGRFIAFPFRPIPGFTNQSDTALYVVDHSITDTFNDDNAAESITDQFPLSTLGRSALTLDGNRFFSETSDQVLPNIDQNSAQDIYLITRGSTNVVLLSFANGVTLTPAEANKPARDPVTNPAGDTAFFISERQLTAADTDRHATIYRALSSNSFLPEAILTPGVTPISLSREATADGQYLVFLGTPASGGGTRPYVLRLSDHKVMPVGAPGPGLPAISADNSTIAFVTTQSFSAQDRNNLGDVYVTPNPFAGAALTAPSFTTFSVAPGGEITAGTSVTVSASATSPNGGIVSLQVEVDGVVNPNLPGSVSLPAGSHTLRALAIDRAGVTKYSSTLSVIVKPAANSLAIRGVKDLVREGEEKDGPISFSGTLQVDNTFSTAQGPLRILLTEAANLADWEIFGGLSNTQRPENILGVLTLASAVSTTPNPSTPSEIPFSSVTRAPEVVSADGFDGIGYTILARLQKFNGSAWVDQGSPFTVFQIRPRLSEQTPGPNGGTPVLEQTQTDANFNPTQVTSINIVGPATQAELTARTYSATGLFTNANPATRPVTPAWSVTSPPGLAVISASGRLTVRTVKAPTKVTLHASFSGKTADLQVTIVPVSPIVSVLAMPRTVVENSGGSAGFRILRTPVKNEPLTVNYTVSGTANDPDRFPFNDYTALSGTAEIPANRAFVDVPVTPVDDTNFEGNESAILTLTPDGAYRLGGARSATVTIIDNEPLPDHQPDAVIRLGQRPPIGANVYNFDAAGQQASANTARGVPVTFTLTFVNRNATTENFSFNNAGGDFLGFTVRFFQGAQDVTSGVQDGSFGFQGVPPGGSVQLRLRITPTAATPLQGVVQCPVTIQTDTGPSDTVQAEVRRIR